MYKLNEITRIKEKELGIHKKSWALHEDIYKYFSKITDKKNLLKKYKMMLRIMKPGSTRFALTFFYRIRRDELDNYLNLNLVKESLSFTRGKDPRIELEIGKNFRITERIIRKIEEDLDKKALHWEYYENIVPESFLAVRFLGEKKFDEGNRYEINDEKINNVEMSILINDKGSINFLGANIGVNFNEIIPLIKEIFKKNQKTINDWIKKSSSI